jgi:hypothetical protein
LNKYDPFSAFTINYIITYSMLYIIRVSTSNNWLRIFNNEIQ